MRNAILSVFNKDGIVKFAQELIALGFKIYSSGGTARALREAGVEVQPIGINILDHRVATLTPEVHAGLLAESPKHDQEMAELGYEYFDLLCVDLYPLSEEIVREGATEASITEKTDIGGPTMLRSAAKGRKIVISSAGQRPLVLDWLKAGEPNNEFVRRELAKQAEFLVSEYAGSSGRALQGRQDYADPSLHVTTQAIMVVNM